MKFIGILLGAGLFLAILIQPVTAVERKDSSIEVSPAYIDISLEKPDEIQQVAVVFTNHSNLPITLQIFPIDFKQADDFGAIQMLQNPGSYSYSLSSFLSLEADTVLLDAGQKKPFMITIKNREDLSPGGHYAAVVAKVINAETSLPSVSPAVSSLILLRKIGGERFNLSLKDVNWPDNTVVFEYPGQINLTFQNEGNIHVIPYGRIDVTDMFGRLIYKGIVNTSSSAVFPESRRHIFVEMEMVEKYFPISINTIKIQGQDSLRKITYSYTETFLYINPIVILVLVLIVVGLVWINKRNKK